MSSTWFEGEIKAYRDRLRRAVRNFERAADQVSEVELNAGGADILAFLRRRVAFERDIFEKLLAVESPDFATVPSSLTIACQRTTANGLQWPEQG
jgi:hypothetical protein